MVGIPKRGGIVFQGVGLYPSAHYVKKLVITIDSTILKTYLIRALKLREKGKFCILWKSLEKAGNEIES